MKITADELRDLRKALGTMNPAQTARLEVAVTAYDRVWQAYTPLDASTVGVCRMLAMTAALRALDDHDIGLDIDPLIDTSESDGG